MLLAFLYHRVHTGKYSNSPKMMEEHLRYLKDHYPILLPGEPIDPFKLSICLTFDDAYFDFYHYVFPLLKELKIKALLAVSPKYLLHSTDLKPEVRLEPTYKTAMKEEVFLQKAPFCTWDELKEMMKSGYVEIASHSYSHIDLTEKNADLRKEIFFSKQILEERLSAPVKTFVYPLGKFNEKVHEEVLKHYTYAMRIGYACNFSWQNQNRLLYRIFSDNLQEKDEMLKKRKFPYYLWNYTLNSIRGR